MPFDRSHDVRNAPEEKQALSTLEVEHAPEKLAHSHMLEESQKEAHVAPTPDPKSLEKQMLMGDEIHKMLGGFSIGADKEHDDEFRKMAETGAGTGTDAASPKADATPPVATGEANSSDRNVPSSVATESKQEQPPTLSHASGIPSWMFNFMN